GAGGQQLSVRPGPTHRDAAREYRAELHGWEPVIEAIVDLFLRMQTRQAEIAATIHFAARSLRGDALFRPSESEVLQAVQLWKQRRKPPLNDEDIARAIRNLN